VGALDQAAPLQGWDLPTEFATLRRLLEARLSGKNRCAAGKREYVQVPRLLETCPMPVVHGAIRDALRLSAISYDAMGTVRNLVCEAMMTEQREASHGDRERHEVEVPSHGPRTQLR